MIGLVLAVSASLIGVVLLLHYWEGIPYGKLTRDPAAIFGAPLYIGFLSQIGIFFWSASTAVCIFSAKILSRHPDFLNIKRFLYVSGLLTLVLGLDDAFLLHEKFFPRIGVDETIVIVIYGGCVLFYLVRFYTTILKTEYMFLGMALIFFGVSITLDFFHVPGLGSYIIEDGAKLVGIVSWLAYFILVAGAAVCRNTTQQ